MMRRSQNICSRLTEFIKTFRLQQIEHLLSRYINDINCVSTAEERSEQKAGLAFFQLTSVT